MSSLQNMLSVYFHMKNHYKKLKNVQSRVNSNNNKSHSAGRAKKSKMKTKESPPTPNKEVKERPPTRRNPNDFATVDKTRNTPLSRSGGPFVRRSPSAKFKTTSLGSQTPRDMSAANSDQHEYLQFSLRITEEIIRNDLYKNDEMVRVLKMHYQANKARLNHDRLLTTIGELCSELNIPLDDNMLLYLEDRGSYSRVCPVDGQQNGFVHQSIPKEFKSHHSPALPSGDQVNHMETKVSKPSIAIGTNPSLHLHHIESDDCTSKQQPDISIDEKELNNNTYEITVIQSPTALEDLSKAFEFGEETLNAPGEESIPALDMKDFQVIHDGTARFNSDKDSDMSIGTKHAQVGDSSNDISQTAIQQFGYQYANNLQLIKTGIKTDLKFVQQAKPTTAMKNLVVSHYTTSVEPSMTETKEFSVQTTSSETQIDTQSQPFYHDASTQKSMTIVDSSESEGRIVVKFQNNSSEDGSIDAIKIKCKCKCETEQGEPTVRVPSQASNFLTSTEAQYVLLDCPVLIPKEHTKSMDILTNRGVHFDNLGKSFHTLMRMAPPPTFLPKEKSSGQLQKPPDLQNSDYYDLTPQKDFFQPEVTAAAVGRSCCSCIANEDNNLLMSNRYDRYKKVSENLSFFYPTIATQVSSMDLIPNDYRIIVPKDDNDRNRDRDLERDRNRDLDRDRNRDLDRDRNRDLDRDRNRELDRDRDKDRYKTVNGDRDRNLDRDRHLDRERDRNKIRDVDRERDRDRDRGRGYSREVQADRYPSYDTMHEIKRSPIPDGGSFYGGQSIPRKEKINLDNYRVESRHNLQGYHPTGQKRHYGEDAIADRDVEKDRIRQTERERGKTKSPRSPGRRHLTDDEEIPKNDKTVKNLYKGSSDSMERRIMTIRQDIEKYSNDDPSSKKNQISQVNSSIPDSSRRNDILEILKPISSPLPTEVTLPRHKKMSVLRKAT